MTTFDQLDKALDGIPAGGLFDAVCHAAKRLTDEELQRLRMWAYADEPRRREQAVRDKLREEAGQAAEAELVDQLVKDGKLAGNGAPTEDELEGPAPEWVNPLDDHSMMYRPGQIVTHNGKTWVSRHPGLNHWEPGTQGVDERIWEEYRPPVDDSPSSPYPEWRAGMAVNVGDIVRYDGSYWKVLQAHTTQSDWVPSQLPALYEPIAPPEDAVPPVEEHDDHAAPGEWRPEIKVLVGEELTYQGVRYRVLQEHHTIGSQTPDTRPDLYEVVG